VQGEDNQVIGMLKSRRSFLTAAATIGLGAAIASPLLAAPDTKKPRRNPRFIDVHHHFFPPQYVAAAAKAGQHLPPRLAKWSAQESLDVMDRSGVASAVISLINLTKAWDAGDPASRRSLARKCNEYGAKIVQNHTGRFGLFACLPMPDVDGSLEEIGYALDMLKADGIGLFTSYGDKWLGDAHFAPVFDELNRRKVNTFIHPYAPSCCARLLPGVNDNFIEFPQDTARAVMSLLFSGTLARHHDARLIFTHGGGPIPVLAGRVATLAATRSSALAKVAPDGIEAELKRLYYDTANAAYRPTMAALLDFAPISQVLFGTDYPSVAVKTNVEDFAKISLTRAQRHAIERGNAVRLMPRFAS
jgi:6-methylsalicylate decarboxylase